MANIFPFHKFDIRINIFHIGILIREVKDMSTSKKNENTKSKNVQEKLNNSVNSTHSDSQNQNHNIKKEALGPNTKR